MPDVHLGEKEIKDKTKLLTMLNDYLSAALLHPTWVDFRKNALKCFRYRESDQWDKQEKAELKSRNQPETVNNQVKVTLDRMLGQFVKNKTRIKFRARNSPEDDALADAFSDVLLFVHQNTEAEFEEREQALDGFTCGLGVTEMGVTFNDLFQPEITDEYFDVLELILDPLSRKYDWNKDARFIGRAKWVDPVEVKELWPEFADKISALMDGALDSGLFSDIDSFKKDNFVDEKLNKMRLVTLQYKIKKRQQIIFMSDGNVLQTTEMSKAAIGEAKKAGGSIIDRIKTQISIATFSADILFEDKESPFDHGMYSYIPFFIDRKKSGEPFSKIWAGLSLQDAINKRESKAMHLLNSNQTFYETGSIVNPAKWAEEIAKPDGQMEMTKGSIERVRVDKNVELATTQFQLHQSAISDFQRVVGINPDAAQEKKDTRSGVGVARIQERADIVVAPDFDNFRRTRMIKARMVHGLIKQFHTEETTFSITDDLDATRQITLNQKKFNAETGEFDVLNDVRKEVIFDLIPENVPDTETIQQEEFDKLSRTLPQILPFGNPWVRILFQMSQIRNKKEILKQIDDINQPAPPDPKISVSLQWSEMTKEEKAAFAQRFGMDELAKFEITKGADPAHVAKAEVDLEREETKKSIASEKSDTDIAKAIIAAEGKEDVKGNTDRS